MPGAGRREAVAADAALAAALLAVDPFALGGVRLRCLPGPVRDGWLAQLAALLPHGAPWRKIPPGVGDERLLGGLDLAATLRAGRPVAGRGLLVEADGGMLLLIMAERMPARSAARVCAVLDAGEAVLERDGFARREPARLGVVALDEGLEPDEQPPQALLERLALHLDLSALPAGGLAAPCATRAEVEAARARLGAVAAGAQMLEALCAAAQALGIDSLRAAALALAASRASAALAGRGAVEEHDVAAASRLVLAPRATRLPQAAHEEPAREQEPPQASEQEPAQDRHADESRAPPAGAGHGGGEHGGGADDSPPGQRAGPPGGVREVVLDAARAAIPPALLARLQIAAAGAAGATSGRAAGAAGTARRGRPAGVRAGSLRAGARLDVVETLRAAAPWQRLRRAQRAGRQRVQVRAADFRLKRFKDRARSTTIFAVDASGSAALHRLAEAKGAVELLLAQCYVRRDRVALVAFRGQEAEVLLPPTRSLVRAKRSLAGLPGGGGTPLACGIEAASRLAAAVCRGGDRAAVVLLTDGRANVGRDGRPGRARAAQDALAAAQALRAGGVRCVLLDTSPRPSPQAREVAAALGADYRPLPYADASSISQAAARAAAAP